MSDTNRAQIMRDKDDLDEKFWQTSDANATYSSDPLSELARIVGRGYTASPDQSNHSVSSHASQPGGGLDRSNDWVNEIEQAFSHIPKKHTPHVTDAVDGRAVPAMPAWLRSPAVPQIPLPEPVPDPRLNPEAFTQDFQHELTSASVPPNAYYADDAYHLATGHGDNPQWDGAWDNSQYSEHYDQSYGAYGDLDGDNRQGYGDSEYDDEAYLTPAPARRRGWVFAAIACGVGVLAVVGAFSFRSGGTISNEIPVIAADSQPVKVEPETPGGEEVPNINKAIYEHTNQVPTGDGAVVVDNREQPVDVEQMLIQQGAAQAQAEAILKDAESISTTTHTTTTGSASDVESPTVQEPMNLALIALGEPKRVRTVSVKPDGTITPSDGPDMPAAPRSAEVAPVAQPEVTANKPAVRAPLQISPQAAPARPAPAQAPQVQVPQVQVSQASVQAAAPVTGNYTVQLAAPGSENEARNLYARLQRKHAELADYSPNVIKAESGGRVIYRLRVGSFPSRDAATALCVRIQATGGQCFVARN